MEKEKNIIQLVFEGEFLKGKKWNGKIYDNEGDDI